MNVHRAVGDESKGSIETLEGGELALPERPPSGPITLVVHLGDRVAAAVLRADVPLVVGRSSETDLCIADATISRRHARFTLRGATVLVEDLGSKNGTWIDGRRVEREEVRFGDGLSLGGNRVSLLASPPPGMPVGRELPNNDRDVAAASGIFTGNGLLDVISTARRVADARVPVMLLGETGTGKEMIARFLHAQSPRRGRPMARVNCGAIPGELVESTFFGHERGAFTGAVQPQKGIFEEAHEGTLFLDEIGELSLSAQAALLRVLEVGAFSRVGSTRELSVDVRVFSATHRDLEAMVREGTFREDLFYRLSTVCLSIPPLRDRRDEIEGLALRFMRAANTANGRVIEAIAPDALARLRAYAWPGNVRELRNVIERGVVLSRGRVIETSDLPPALRAGAGLSGVAEVSDPTLTSAGRQSRLLDYEARFLSETLEACGWKTAEAARRLNMARRTLTRRMLVLGIKAPAQARAGQTKG